MSFPTQCDLSHTPSRHRYTSSRHSNGDEEVCPEAEVKEEGQTVVVVVVVVVRNWLGSCVCYRIGSAGLTVLLCNLD